MFSNEHISFLKTINILVSVLYIDIFIIFAVDLNASIMRPRTPEEWNRLQDNAISAILTGRTANPYYGDWSIESLISDAIAGADHLIKELKKREEKEIPSPLTP